MTIGQALKTAILKLKEKNINNPHLDAEILLAHILDKNREYILAHQEKHLSLIENLKFNYKIKKRIKGLPLAYLTGEKEFFGYNFHVNKHTLIPRPETEMIIEEIIKSTKPLSNTALFIDIGTGSGCIPIAIFKELKKTNNTIPGSQFHAIDISAKAVKIAKKNASLHNANITFHVGNLLEPVQQKLKNLDKNTKVFITANLPYLTPEQVKDSPTIQNEPQNALVAGSDGLLYYRELFIQLNSILVDNPLLNYYLICEIDPLQVTAIEELSIANLDQIAQSKKDLRGLDRFVSVRNF